MPNFSSNNKPKFSFADIAKKTLSGTSNLKGKASPAKPDMLRKAGIEAAKAGVSPTEVLGALAVLAGVAMKLGAAAEKKERMKKMKQKQKAPRSGGRSSFSSPGAGPIPGDSEDRMSKYPTHWSVSGGEHLRADGVKVRISLSPGDWSELERRIGWTVLLPMSMSGSMVGRYDEHFLPGDKYRTVASALKKVDQTWEPSGHLKAIIPADWLGHELEQLAREAPSMAHEPRKEPASLHPDEFGGTDYDIDADGTRTSVG
jgi:hypothetical protein